MKKLFLMFLLIAITVLAFSDDIDEARELLLAEEGGNILYLSRINFGFPGGDNWIANRSDGYTYIYTINDDKEVKREDLLSFPELSNIRYLFSPGTYRNLEYDIMRGIPGTRLGSKAANIGDYNGDGIDEIFIIYRAPWSGCSIWRYDNDKGKGIFYFDCRFELISSREPAPVVFADYQGIEGILVHLRDHLAERYIWMFFVWDEESLEYKEMMEIPANEIDWSMFTIVRNESSQIDSEPAVVESVVADNEIEPYKEENTFEETAIFPPADSGKSTKSMLYIVIISAIAVLAAVVVFIVLKMKKK